MNYTIKVDGKIYAVKILDLHSIPIRVIVDDTEIEVWPEQNISPTEGQAVPSQAVISAPAAHHLANPAQPAAATAAHQTENSLKAVKAPLPGVIVSVKVKVGEMVSPGQELCTIEAMKMKNIIRATRSGRIATIAVNVGETIQHHDLLMEYEG